jgi:hypothetical protein
MAVWKLECWSCGRHNADFVEVGLELRCRRCKKITTIPFGVLRTLEDAIAFAKAQRRQAKRTK